MIWRKTILLFFILMSTGNVFSQDNVNVFQQNAIRYSSSFFHEDDRFTILGNMEINGKKIVFANNVHIWGEAGRATWRFLLFLDDGTFLGMYTGIVFDPTEIKIEGQRILFPFNPELGNVMEFSDSIPDRVWLDGEVFLFLKISDG